MALVSLDDREKGRFLCVPIGEKGPTRGGAGVCCIRAERQQSELVRSRGRRSHCVPFFLLRFLCIFAFRLFVRKQELWSSARACLRVFSVCVYVCVQVSVCVKNPAESVLTRSSRVGSVSHPVHRPTSHIEDKKTLSESFMLDLAASLACVSLFSSIDLARGFSLYLLGVVHTHLPLHTHTHAEFHSLFLLVVLCVFAVMSIDALLQAAEYLERREREAEHGYASSLPMPIEDYGSSPTPSGSSSSSATTSSTTRPIKIKKNQGSRSTHNELEKNRRAQLRTCLEKLKDLVPLGPESARHTTLGLLTRAKHFIKTLEERDRRHLQHKEQLNREQRFLRRKMEQLSQHFEQLSSSSPGASNQMNKRRGNSLSECSVSTTISSASSLTSSVSSETGIAAYYDEVDVIGYGSHGSDLDDQLSVQSASSDSGIGLGNVASIGHFPHLSITDSV